MYSSISKILNYISCVSTADVQVKFKEKPDSSKECIVELPANSKVKINASVWHKDYCNCCGQCCRNYDTVFSPNEFLTVKHFAEQGSQPHQEIVDKAVQIEMEVNNVKHTFWSVPPMTNKDSHNIMVNTGTCLNCRWIDLNLMD